MWISLTVAENAFAQFADHGSNTDLFEGAVVTAVDAARGGDEPGDIFLGGPDADLVEVGGSSYIFGDQSPTQGVDFIEFNTADPVSITGINLIVLSDDESFRATSSFSLLADVDNDNSYETTLVSGVNPVDNRTDNLYDFADVTASRFRAEFTRVNGGPRVIELDAIAVPEPTALSLAGLGALGLLTRRRRA